MAFPTTEQGLKDAGYTFKNEAKCKGCDVYIEWWETPKGKMMPLDSGTLEPHWGACPARDQFNYNKPRNPKSDAPSAKDDGYRKP